MKYKKRQIIIEAVQWKASKQSFDEIMSLGDVPWELGETGSETFLIKTLEGNMLVRKNDWVIRGVSGEFYPCKPDIFEKTYEKVLNYCEEKE